MIQDIIVGKYCWEGWCGNIGQGRAAWNVVEICRSDRMNLIFGEEMIQVIRAYALQSGNPDKQK